MLSSWYHTRPRNGVTGTVNRLTFEGGAEAGWHLRTSSDLDDDDGRASTSTTSRRAQIPDVTVPVARGYWAVFVRTSVPLAVPIKEGHAGPGRVNAARDWDAFFFGSAGLRV